VVDFIDSPPRYSKPDLGQAYEWREGPVVTVVASVGESPKPAQ
jgi:hypothetical protein